MCDLAVDHRSGVLPALVVLQLHDKPVQVIPVTMLPARDQSTLKMVRSWYPAIVVSRRHLGEPACRVSHDQMTCPEHNGAIT